jgi:hypothetical protein
MGGNMSLPTLSINSRQIGHNSATLGFDFIVTSLRDSGLFKIEDHKESINVVKGCRATMLYFNGKKIYLDFWEYSAPTHNTAVLEANFDLIIKLQHKNIGRRRYLRFVKNKNLFKGATDEQLVKFYNKIVPWTFFPSRMMMPYVGKEETLTSLPIEQLGFFCGRNWKARHYMKAKLESQGIKYISNEVPGQRISDDNFLHLMRSSKFGIVLPGRSTYVSDCKNRREIDYMMMKKPLLISYQPNYYDPLVNGKHYIYIDDKTVLKDLENMYNINEIAENAYQWYLNNATPKGMAQMFLKIMTDKGFNI